MNLKQLMDILSYDDHSDIVSWLPHGKGFTIYNKKRFAAEILPKYFKQAKFTSFTRKLNRWNFSRITRGPETGAYYHEYFQKGNLRLCMQMCCQNAKNLAAMKEHHEYTSPSMDDAAIELKVSQLAELGPPNDAILQGYGGVGGANQLFPGALVNQGNSISQFASDNIFKIRQLEQQRQELMMQQQQAELAQLNQMAGLSLSRQQQNLLSPLANTNPPSSNQDQFTATMIQRGNASAYLAMIMAQEKLSTQMGSLGGLQNVSPMDVQRQQANLLHAQQQQMDQYSQQRMYQQAALQQQHQLQQQLQQLQLQQQLQQQQLQQQAQCLDLPNHLLNMFQQNTGEDSPPSVPGKPNKRTSSAA
jgi:hypothetical protein